MRTFFCIELESSTKDALSETIRRLKPTDARVRWVYGELMHVTLKFLGDIDPQQTIELKALTERIVQPYRAFQLTLNKLGAFPNLDRPRVVWAGAHHTPETLLKLQEDLDAALSDLGFRRERNFSLHVTLGRVRESNPQALRQLRKRIEMTQLTPLHIQAKAITLMESVLSAKGPTYIPAFREPLQIA